MIKTYLWSADNAEICMGRVGAGQLESSSLVLGRFPALNLACVWCVLLVCVRACAA